MEWNYEIAISLNTIQSNWPVNLFVSANFGNQTLFNLQSKVEMFGDLVYNHHFSNFTYGLYKQLNDNQRIIIGLRRNWHPEADRDLLTNNYILQYDFQF